MSGTTWVRVENLEQVEAIASQCEWQVILRGRRVVRRLFGLWTSIEETNCAVAGEIWLRPAWDYLAQQPPYDVIEVRERWADDPSLDISLSKGDWKNKD